MGAFLGIGAMSGFVVCIVFLIYFIIRKKNIRNCLIGAGACIVLFVIALSISPGASATIASSKLQSSLDNTPYSQQVNSKNNEGNCQTSEGDGHITKSTYDQIKSGMTYDEVKKIIGSDGENIFESGDKGTASYQISYMWLGENGGEATISFSGTDQLKVLMKSQSGLK